MGLDGMDARGRGALGLARSWGFLLRSSSGAGCGILGSDSPEKEGIPSAMSPILCLREADDGAGRQKAGVARDPNGRWGEPKGA